MPKLSLKAQLLPEVNVGFKHIRDNQAVSN